MKYEDFKNLAQKIVWDTSGNDYFSLEGDCIFQSHKTGGASGGDCWGGEPRYYSNDDPMDNFLPLDKLLMETKPDISYLGYKTIENMIESDRKTESEYYGNYTEYTIKKLNLKKLYDFIFND